MTFEDAVRDSMRAYYKDRLKLTSEDMDDKKKIKYNKKYFDRFETTNFGDVYKVKTE